MTDPYRLHYAPDNASLIVRLVLEQQLLPYHTALVDRSTGGQRAPGYLALNPNGLIPTLETPVGPIYETGAILLWLSDTHGGSAPSPGDPTRGSYLKWLFFTSNTLHSDLRMSFYPDKYAGPDPAGQNTMQSMAQRRLAGHVAQLETLASTNPPWLSATTPSGLCWYLACCLRWMALYPENADRSWFSLQDTPHLYKMLETLETLPATHAAQTAEGLGPTPFTAPVYATPTEGSAT